VYLLYSESRAKSKAASAHEKAKLLSVDFLRLFSFFGLIKSYLDAI